jgi:thiol-disulfide isomerase/thioredoxin
MSTPTAPKSLPDCLIQAAELRRDGLMNDAVSLVETELAEFRAKPFDTPFRDRVQLGLALADLYLATGQREPALNLLRTEAAFADQITWLMRQSGSPEQVRAASAGRYQLRDRAAQVALIGQPAPEIEVADWVLGGPTTLAEQRGNVVLLEFWSRWCRPCLAMFPVLRELHNRYAERGLTIIALTCYGRTDRVRERDAIEQTIADRGLEIAVGIAPDGRLQQQYGAVGIPAATLVDRTGIVAPAPPASEKANLERSITDLLNAPA